MAAFGAAVAAGLRPRPALARWLGELWVHHTHVSDASAAGVLRQLVMAGKGLRELHL
eukprot:gene6835-22762_t